jgi:hypothetical protein
MSECPENVRMSECPKPMSAQRESVIARDGPYPRCPRPRSLTLHVSRFTTHTASVIDRHTALPYQGRNSEDNKRHEHHPPQVPLAKHLCRACGVNNDERHWAPV